MSVDMNCSSYSPRVRSSIDIVSLSMVDSGVEMIPIQTPVGEFDVRMERVSDNLRIKLLLLHDGPSASHEFLHNFFLLKVLSFITMINLVDFWVMSRVKLVYGQ